RRAWIAAPRSGHLFSGLQDLTTDDGAGHDEPICAEWCSRGEARDQSLLDQVEHLVKIHLARVQVGVNRSLGPVGETWLPQWAVVNTCDGLLRHLVQNIEGRLAGRQTRE